MLIVTAPIYILLQMFGVVNPGIYFIIGIIFYFCLGVLIDFVGSGVMWVCNKIPHFPLRAIFK